MMRNCLWVFLAVLLAATSSIAVERVVLAEEFTGTW